jgi:hypothetical protein
VNDLPLTRAIARRSAILFDAADDLYEPTQEEAWASNDELILAGYITEEQQHTKLVELLRTEYTNYGIHE